MVKKYSPRKKTVVHPRVLSQASCGQIQIIRFLFVENKIGRCGTSTYIFVTCTVGTQKTPILEYYVDTLLARHSIGDRLLNLAPMFAIPIQDKSLQVSFLPLSYDDISAADKIRTSALGAEGIPFRSHLRRKGETSDLLDAGEPKEDIFPGRRTKPQTYSLREF